MMDGIGDEPRTAVLEETLPGGNRTAPGGNQTSPGGNEEARLGWLALTLTPGMGPTRCGRAVRGLGAAEHVFTASLTELEGVGMPAEAAQFCLDGRARAAAMEEAARVVEQGANFLTPEDEAYPERLLQIYDPPAVLWVRGDVAQLSRAGIAVVGTRQPSPYGAGMAEMLSRDLARRCMVIMSGMARGVDTCAHKARWRWEERRLRCGARGST
jgi:DNA processing protein